MDKLTEQALEEAKGKRISDIVIHNNIMFFKFQDKTGLVIFDQEQRCCESRYLSTDDNLNALNYQQFAGIVIKEITHTHTNSDAYEEDHEICFVEIQTTTGESIVLQNHNEHNGFYEGFDICVRKIDTDIMAKLSYEEHKRISR